METTDSNKLGNPVKTQKAKLHQKLSSLSFLPRARHLTMQIFVQGLGGSHFCLNIPSSPHYNSSTADCCSSSIFSIKSVVQRRSGVPAGLQRLTHGGRELCNTNVLSDYGIEDGATVRLALRLRGGGSCVLRYGSLTIRARKKRGAGRGAKSPS